jgi:adenylate cyclase
MRAFEQARSWDRASAGRALNLLTQAITRDPHYGAALALAAHCRVMQLMDHATDSYEADRREAIDLAQRAIRAPGNDPSALGMAAFVFGNLGEDIRAAIALVDHALEITPSYAGGWYYSGWLRLWAGQSNIAIDHFTRAARLSPYEMPSRVLIGIGISQFFVRDFDQAKATLRQSLQEFPNWPPTQRFLAACCAHMGQLEEARQVIERLRLITSDIVPSAAHWLDQEQRELYLSGLRLAAGENA